VKIAMLFPIGRLRLTIIIILWYFGIETSVLLLSPTDIPKMPAVE